MSIHFHDTERRLSVTLRSLVARLPPDGMTLRQLLEALGEQGLLLFCLLLTLPNLLPVTIPGSSTAAGLLIALIGVGVVSNRMPWLPKRLMARRVSHAHLSSFFQRGMRLFERLERVLRPRLLVLTHGASVNRLNGAMLVVSGLLLAAPLTVIPLSNPLPALASFLFALGILQRDGLAILLGWVMVAVTSAYFGGLIYAAVHAGRSLL